MDELTIFEIFQNVFSQLFSSSFLIYLVGFLILIAGIYLLTRRKKSKLINILIGLSWVCYMAAIVWLALPVLSQILSSAVQGILTQLYFPSIATLVIILMITYGIGISSYLKKEKTTLITKINKLFFLFMNLLFGLLIYQFMEKKWDLSAGILLYKEKDLLSILELITFSFVLLLFFNIIAKITSLIMKKIEARKSPNLKS